MEEQLITLDTAKLAKKAGFNCNVYHYSYSGSDIDYHIEGRTFHSHNFNEEKEKVSISTQALLQKWLREKHEIFICCSTKNIDGKIKWQTNHSMRENIHFDTYEEALEVGLQETLKLIK